MNFAYYFGGDSLVTMGLIAIAALVSIFAQTSIQRAYAKYKQTESTSHLTGRQVAEKILQANGIYDVNVVQGSGGELSDFYDPKNKVVSLSSNVYNTNSIAAIAVASHEVGHAIQHATGYGAIALRNTILPFAIVSNNLSMMILLAGFFLSMPVLIWAGIALYGVGGLFQLVTLPVEFDASKRAIENIQSLAFVDQTDIPDMKKMLNAAAFTYVAAFIATIAQLLRLVLLANRRNEN